MEESLLSELENDKYVSQINLQKQQKINEKQIEKDEIKAINKKIVFYKKRKLLKNKKLKKTKKMMIK